MKPGIRHHLSTSELAAIGAGAATAETLARLRAAQLSRHLLLLEHLRRTGRGGAGAFALLAAVQRAHPRLVAVLLGLPQVGGWAERAARGPHTAASGGFPARLAAGAALRARHPCAVDVPVVAGAVVLPGVGVIRPPGASLAGTARLRVTRARATVTAAGVTSVVGGAAPLVPVARLHSRAGGRTLRLLLDACDPELDRFGAPLVPDDAVDLPRWRRRLDGAWALLARHHPDEATTLAGSVRTLVPLAGAAAPAHATSGWLSGAIGLSLPPDPVSLAEVLVHESRHVVLGAVEDVLPLTRAGAWPSAYAPWRDDPRPPAALLQGCYAHAGVAAFWRSRRHAGGPDGWFPGHVAYARWRAASLDTAEWLLASGALTEPGTVVAAALRDRLRGWLGDPVPAAAAERAAGELAAHRERVRST